MNDCKHPLSKKEFYSHDHCTLCQQQRIEELEESLIAIQQNITDDELKAFIKEWDEFRLKCMPQDSIFNKALRIIYQQAQRIEQLEKALIEIRKLKRLQPLGWGNMLEKIFNKLIPD